MRFKVIYTIGDVIHKAIIEGPTIQDAMREGAKRLKWDSLLEATTEDDRSLQGKV